MVSDFLVGRSPAQGAARKSGVSRLADRQPAAPASMTGTRSSWTSGRDMITMGALVPDAASSSTREAPTPGASQASKITSGEQSLRLWRSLAPSSPFHTTWKPLDSWMRQKPSKSDTLLVYTEALSRHGEMGRSSDMKASWRRTSAGAMPPHKSYPRRFLMRSICFRAGT